MAIALPPPITPQLTEIEQIQSLAHQTWEIDYQGVTIHLSGELVAPEQTVRNAVAAAGSISDAVRAIGAVYYSIGYPATLVSYAPSGDHELYVRVVPAHVAEVSGAAALLPYFRKLAGAQPLHASQLERARALADSLSQRAGLNYQLEFRPLADDAVVLDVGNGSGAGEPLAISGDFNNYGNRYAGPYLADISVRQSTASGDEVVVGGTTNVHTFDLGGSRSRPYREGDGSWSRVTPFGVFGVEGRYADFGQDIESVRLDGKLTTAAASWLTPLYADFDNRLLLEARVDRSHEAIDAHLIDGFTPALLSVPGLLQILGLTAPPPERVQVLSELYNSAQISLSGVSRVAVADHVLEINARLSARKGLGKSSHGQTEASLSYFLLQPAIGLRYGLTGNFDVLGDAQFQLSNSVVPQLEQLVIGGPASLHGYDAGVGVGDHGQDAHLAVEWHGSDDSWAARYHIRPRAFVEYGATTLTLANAVDESAGRVRLADVGLSVEASPIDAVSISLSVAQSIYDHSDQDSLASDSRKYVFFQLSGRY